MNRETRDDWWKDGNGRREPKNHLAIQAMDAEDRLAAKDAGLSPAEYLRKQYGVDAGDYHLPENLREDVIEAATAGGD